MINDTLLYKDDSPESISSLSVDASSSDPMYLSRAEISLYQDPPVLVSKIHDSISYIQNALDHDIYPVLLKDCTGGSYRCYNQYGGVEAIFKPFDEEPYCIHNPKGLTPSKLTEVVNRDVIPGTGGLREVVAFYLDYGHFAGVPETVIASLCLEVTENSKMSTMNSNHKEGSLQVFIPHECSSEDYGPVLFSVSNIQSISILDMRLFNLDRHENNLLVTRHRERTCSHHDDVLLQPESRASDEKRRAFSTNMNSVPENIVLVPIDHGYSLPAYTTHALPEWCWRRWYQSKVEVTEEVKEYVKNLDIEKDILLLQKFLPGLDESTLNTLRITTLWLQCGLEANLSIYSLSSFFFPREVGIKSGFQHVANMYNIINQSKKIDCCSFLQDTGKAFMKHFILESCVSLFIVSLIKQINHIEFELCRFFQGTNQLV